MSIAQVPDGTLPGASLLVDGHHHDSPTWAELVAARDAGEVLWLDVERPTEDDLHRLAEVFGLHEEMVRDSLDFRQRTRLTD
jgi:Mg2+ and Co2+ transporter CorA